MKRLQDRVVAITGASSGIGRATAAALAREGAAVAVSARRRDRLDELVQEIERGGGRALAVPGDVTIEADMQAFVAGAVAAWGRLDVMMCNAGIGYHGTLDDTPADVMRRLVDVNLMGTMYAASAALPIFRRQRRGHIIAISSIAGRRGIGGMSLYSATKAAQIGFIEGLRAEFVGSDLHASVIYPVSTTDTEFREAIHRDYGREITGKGPKQTADDVARLIVECVVTPRAEVYTLAKAKWFAVLGVVAPARSDRLTKKFGRRVLAPGEADGDGSA
jgi:NADP-dependent 3-hydroxy acid dehydrogenase YdfG